MAYFLFEVIYLIMLGLIITTIITSATDSLNPIAITQQFILQGMVRKPNHIWYFILPTGIVNFISGVLVYYGLGSIFTKAMDIILNTLTPQLFIAELIIGVLSILFALFLFYKKKIKNDLYSESNSEEDDKKIVSEKIKSVSPVSLVILGIIATISELATALPYFAFLAVLLTHKLSVLSLIIILFIYNFIYTSPLILLYFIYRKNQNIFEKFYLFIKNKMKKFSIVLVPMILVIIGVAISIRAINFLI